MALSSTSKVIVSLLSASSVGGGVAYGYYELTKETFRDKLKGTLLTSGTEDIEKWKTRAVTLQSDSKVSASLKLIKDANDNTGTKLQNWCNVTLESTFSNEEDKLFKEVQKYCVYTIKEKIGKVVEISKWDNATHDKKLKENKDNKPLSKNMADIKAKIETSKSPDKDALKTWCGKAYEMVFKGGDDQDFKDAKEYCFAD